MRSVLTDMTVAQSSEPTPRKPLRLWPGVVIVVLQWLIILGLPIIAPEQGGYAIIGGFAGGVVVVLWWLFFSRAAWLERLGAIVLMVMAVAANYRLVHESIANGMMGYMLILYSVPLLSLALVAWAVVTRGLSNGRRRAWLVVAIVMACGTLTVVRTNGITGDAASDFEWRWTPTAEQRLLADAHDEPAALPSAPAATETPREQIPAQTGEVQQTLPSIPATAETPEEHLLAQTGNEPAVPPAVAKMEAGWPGFRGSERDGIIHGVRIETDWSRTPPAELWRQPIGPGWSSFAVSNDRIYTQEQRGDDEVVSAYELKTGEAVWRHRDAARFWESNAGAGPRGTPTLSNGRVYTLGATGILNALDADNGAVVWSRNAVSDTSAKIPDWGIASSPLVVGDVVIAATAGSLAAYDVATGNPRWFGPKGGWGYSSPHLLTIDGVVQVVFVNGPGAIGLAPLDGTVLWKHEWPGDSIVQPAVMSGGDLLIGSGSGLGGKTGMLRITVANEPGGWIVKEHWTSIGLKPYFNDFVVHDGHAFGFDGSMLACIDLQDGKRKWKGGHYGHGQLVLLADQGLLLVLSEKGELALVTAASDQFTELAKFPAIKGKTWNHPVLVGDTLLVRNDHEMVAFRLSLAGR